MDFLLPTADIEVVAGSMTPAQSVLLTAYGEAILRGSRSMNLVSRRELDTLGEHFVDAAALLSFLDPGDGELGDLGSGAGFPGLVVAILRPEARVTLVDSRRSKVVFLKDVKRQLGLDNVTVVHGRLEELEGKLALKLAAARALGSIEKVLAPSLRVLSPGGRLVLFKGPQWQVEVEAARVIAAQEGAEISRTETVPLPGLDRATTFVEFHVKLPAER